MSRPWSGSVSILAALIGLWAAGPVSAAPGEPAPTSDGPGLTITAGARWGTSTPERWTPYVITVKNQGSADFEGEVVLIPEPVPPLPPGPAAAAVAALQGTPLLIQPLAWKIGAQTVTTPRPSNRVYVVPDPAEFPVYRVPVVVAVGSEKTVHFTVLQAPAGYRAELRDSHGKTLETVPGEQVTPATNALLRGLVTNASQPRPVLLLSRNPQAKAELENNRAVLATHVNSPADVPDDALLLSSLYAVVVDDFDTGALSPAQWSAIRQFVSLGGSLVLAGGAGAEAALKAAPPELVPLRITGSTEVSMGPLADLVGRPTTVAATVTTGELERGRSVVSSPDGVPLVVSAQYGAGRVVQFAYDPLAEVFSADRVLRTIALDQGLSRALNPWGSGFQAIASAVAPEDQLWDPTFQRPRWPAWPSRSLWMLLLFVAAVALLTTVAARTPRRARTMWAAIPLAVVLAGSATVAVGAGREDDFKKDVVIKTLGVDGTVAKTVYRGLQELRPRSSVKFTDGTATTRFIEPGAIRTDLPDEFGALNAPPRRGDGKGAVVVRGDGVELEQPARPWQARTVQHLSIGQVEGGLEAHLRLVGTAAPPAGGMRVQGEVTNDTGHTLRQLRAQLPEGGQARLADTLNAGASVTVDAPIVWAARSVAEPGHEAPSLDLLLFAAASRSFTGQGQVALVAEEAPPAGSDGRSTTIVVQPTPAEEAERPMAYQSSPTLIASGPGSANDALMNTYDFSATPGHGPLSLGYAPNPAVTRIEVYDWTARTWRSLPTTAPPPPPGQQPAVSVPLNPTESNKGLIRVRAVPNFAGNLGLTSQPPLT